MNESANCLVAGPTIFDVVILSFAKDEALRQVTDHCLNTLVASEDPSRIQFRIVVLESNPKADPYPQAGVETIFPAPPFNYHGYMNRGIKMGNAPFVAICNNDLEFHPGWASALVDEFEKDSELQSASPLCSRHHPGCGFSANSGSYSGYRVLREVAGWCLVFRRDMLKVTGMLDERFYFWYADDDYARTLQQHGLKHALVTASIVNHLESRTLKSHSSVSQVLLTRKAKYTFEAKWKGHSRTRFFGKMLKLYLQLPLYYLGIKKL
ncbi:glycosyltransferase family 2 protein [Phytopseudomonas dryadis]|uniref:glycosyltransferase family 2 protein n=1 Tax=Pseudomonadaceae TaxID=135621 RepID=UPI001A955004|nr:MULTISPECIES: hypothetical protein [Pseudomonas]